MATYYVKAYGGDDAAAGTSPATAWATVEYADTQLVAGDTVWLSPGYHTYYYHWKLTASGTKGSPILWKGDFLGVEFGMDKGVVRLGVRTRAPESEFVWDLCLAQHFGEYQDGTLTGYGIEIEDLGWLEFHNITFGGRSWEISVSGRSIRILGSAGSNYAAEGVRFSECIFWASPDYGVNVSSVYVDLTKANGNVLAGDGLTFERCLFLGGEGVYLYMDESTVQECDLKIVFASCLWVNHRFNIDGGRSLNTTYEVGGFSFLNNTFFTNDNTGTQLSLYSHPAGVNWMLNNLWHGSFFVYLNDGTTFVLSTNIEHYFSKATRFSQSTAVEAGKNMFDYLALSLGGIADMLNRIVYGWSPWLPFESITKNGGVSSVSGGAFDANTIPDYDYYGFPIDRANGIAWEYLDGSYETASGTSWSSPTNATNGNMGNYARQSTTSQTTLSMAGVTISGITGVVGDNVWVIPVVAWDDDIDIDNRYFAVAVEYLTEALVTENVRVPDSDSGVRTAAAISVPAPSAGWTRDAIEKLRVKITPFKNSGNVSAYVYQVIVAFELYNTRAIGAVSGIAKLKEETTIVRSGSSSRLDAWGWWQKAMYLFAGTYTFSVYARYESDYSGTLPTLEVEIPEDEDTYTDAMTGAADTWEQLSVTFTLTEDRTVVLRLKSYNVAQGGYCYFDDLESE